jgi:hypothetical protein
MERAEEAEFSPQLLLLLDAAESNTLQPQAKLSLLPSAASVVSFAP